MKINLVFLGIPAIDHVVPQSRMKFELKGVTAENLLHELIDEFGTGLSRIFFDEEGRFDPTIQMIINGKKYISIDSLGVTYLEEDDTVIFAVLVDGG